MLCAGWSLERFGKRAAHSPLKVSSQSAHHAYAIGMNAARNTSILLPHNLRRINLALDLNFCEVRSDVHSEHAFTGALRHPLQVIHYLFGEDWVSRESSKEFRGADNIYSCTDKHVQSLFRQRDKSQRSNTAQQFVKHSFVDIPSTVLNWMLGDQKNAVEVERRIAKQIIRFTLPNSKALHCFARLSLPIVSELLLCNYENADDRRYRAQSLNPGGNGGAFGACLPSNIASSREQQHRKQRIAGDTPTLLSHFLTFRVFGGILA